MHGIGWFIVVAAQVIAASPTKTGTSGNYLERKTEQGQQVIFVDDPLSAVGHEAFAGVLVLRPTAARTLLLRPRTQFTTELCKSIENL